ncbi:hypothetical protein ALT721_1800006 [Alteromonas alvinellae]
MLTSGGFDDCFLHCLEPFGQSGKLNQQEPGERLRILSARTSLAV